MHNQKDYMADIDNLTPCRSVRNFLIGPVYAHKEHINGNEKANRTQFNRQKPIGMIQLVNKAHYEKIDPHDVRKFEAIQNLIGLSIDQVSEVHSFINIRVGVQERIDNIEAMLLEQLKIDK